jgi:hypothetical protein
MVKTVNGNILINSPGKEVYPFIYCTSNEIHCCGSVKERFVVEKYEPVKICLTMRK